MKCVNDVIDLRKCGKCDKFTCYESGKVRCSMNKTSKEAKEYDQAYTLARYDKTKRIIRKE